jgi:hypothetical protein
MPKGGPTGTMSFASIKEPISEKILPISSGVDCIEVLSLMESAGCSSISIIFISCIMNE